MGCVKLPAPSPLPSLGLLSLEPPPLPAVDVSVNFCCKVQLISFKPTIPLGAVLALPGASTIIAGINKAMTVAEAYIDAIPLSCPKDE
jgi:hypothetical protein